MTAAELRALLADVPDATVVPAPEDVATIDAAVRYLESDAAITSIAVDTYWPKWASPWWQMTLLWELGLAQRIPARVVRAMVDGLNALPLHIFPIRPDEWPPGSDPRRDISCHCALGTMDQVLTACGVDVDAELPWVRPWFERYQMADGGLNCDDAAYAVTDECPSSMVGTVAAFEAMLRRGDGAFVARAAAFLIDRQLRLGSPTRHNAEERDAALAWTQLTFPRFYYYDVLRGLAALVRWATQLTKTIPVAAISDVVRALVAQSRDGTLVVGRQAYAAIGTWAYDPDGTWTRKPKGGHFPLLDATSRIGGKSAALTRSWQDTRRSLVALIDAGRVA